MTMPELFAAADSALLDLYRCLKYELSGTEGSELWREVLRMRIKLNYEIRPMCEDSFAEKTR